MEIDHVVIKDAKVKLNLSFLKGEGLAISLPDIHLQDIGKKTNGATWQKITTLILERLESVIFQSVPGSGTHFKRGIKKIGETLKKLGPEAEEAVSGVVKGLKGILN